MLSLLAGGFTACDLDIYPEDQYHEYNTDGVDDDTAQQYTTRADILGARNSMYEGIKGSIQEAGFMDVLVVAEVLSDNSYGGSGDLVLFDNFTFDADHKNIERDWNYYLARVSSANEIITYIDLIEDPTLTAAEKAQWKAEAMIWRAWNWFDMSQLWGDVPLVDQAPPVITSDNIEEVYHFYYPDRVSRLTVFEKIASDLEEAVKSAPELNSADKFVFSKAVANALLAKVYAEEPIQDWAKVASYCAAVEAMNLSLVADYDDLWAVDLEAKDVVMRHSSESLFEVPYSPSSDNWVWMMFWRNSFNPEDAFNWAKWLAPSRNLTAAFEAAGDDIRYASTVIWDNPTWRTSVYSDPASPYPFMHKFRSNASSIIKMRLAEIYLLHAEALAHTGDLTGAAGYVNRVRERVELDPVTASGADAMLDAILNERRLELAFEGHRWFDLKRFGKAVECVNGFNVASSPYYDEYKPKGIHIDETRLLMPVPGKALDNNPSLEQNTGL